MPAAAELVAKSRLELESHVDHLIMRLQSRITQGLALYRERLSGLEGRLQSAARIWPVRGDHIGQLEHRLERAMAGLLRRLQDQLGRNAGRLDALSPLSQLARGYVIASRDPAGGRPADFSELAVGEQLWLRFAKGRARTRIEDLSE